MKRAEVQVGKVYAVRIGGQFGTSPVRIQRFYRPSLNGRQERWVGVNLRTGREITGTAARCRREIPETLAADLVGKGRPA